MVGESQVKAEVYRNRVRLQNGSPRRTFAADSVCVDHFQL